jgi:hypothetical protein
VSAAASCGRRIRLLGPYGSGNLGDAAIQEAAIHHFCTRLPGVQLVGICAKPARAMEIHGIPGPGYARYRPPGWSDEPASGYIPDAFCARSKRVESSSATIHHYFPASRRRKGTWSEAR